MRARKIFEPGGCGVLPPGELENGKSGKKSRIFLKGEVDCAIGIV